MRLVAISGLLLLALGSACADDDEKSAAGPTAEAALEPRSGNTTLSGTATFREKNGKVTLTLRVAGAPEGVHGVHIHETGDCSAVDAMSAGGHWNPSMHMHGKPEEETHLGDLGNLTVQADGTGTLTLSKEEWTVGDDAETDVVGKAVVIHAMPDDFTTQPTGNSGGRIGCGEIDLFLE